MKLNLLEPKADRAVNLHVQVQQKNDNYLNKLKKETGYNKGEIVDMLLNACREGKIKL